jgi:hypothetical protein
MFEIAKTFKIQFNYVSKTRDLSTFGILDIDTPIIIECVCTQDQQVLPSQAFKDGKQAPLHDMIPFLSDEELQQEMVVKL